MLPRAALALTALVLLAARPAAADALDDAVSARCPLDRRLGPAASQALEAHDPLDLESLRDLAETAGSTAPSVRAWVARGESSALARAASAWLAAHATGTVSPRCGLARDGNLVALVMVPRTAVVRGIRSRVAAGDHGRYAVLLPEGTGSAALMVAAPGGAVSRVEGPAPFDIVFDAQGTYALQLLAETPQGPLPFATWHVQSGGDTAAAAYGDADDASGNSDADADAERPEPPPPAVDARDVLRAINRARLAAGATALRADPLLGEIAQRRAAELAARGAVAHGLGGEDSPVHRMSLANLGADRLAENVARARSLDEASARLDRSPSHRANRVDPEMDAAGIGVAVAGASVYLVELYALHPRIAEPAPAVETAEP